MSYAEDNFHDRDFDESLLYGSDYDLDSTRLIKGEVEFISIPAWRMNDGNLIAIQDMDTSHIKNCMKMIYQRNGNWRTQYLKYFKEELMKRKYLPPTPPIIYIDL